MIGSCATRALRYSSSVSQRVRHYLRMTYESIFCWVCCTRLAFVDTGVIGTKINHSPTSSHSQKCSFFKPKHTVMYLITTKRTMDYEIIAIHRLSVYFVSIQTADGIRSWHEHFDARLSVIQAIVSPQDSRSREGGVLMCLFRTSELNALSSYNTL